MKKLIPYFKPYLLQIIFSLIFLLGQALTDLSLPNYMSQIVDQGIANGDIALVRSKGMIMLVIALLGVVFSLITSYLSSKISMGFSRDLRSAVYRKVESFSLNEFNRLGTATLINRTTNDITQVQTLVMMALRVMAMAPIMAIGGIIMALSQDSKLSIVIVVVVPILAVIITVLLMKGTPYFQVIQQKLDNLNLVLRENLTGVRVIRAFNRIDSERIRYDDASKELKDIAIQVNKIMSLLMPSVMTVMNFATIALVWLGGQRIAQSDLHVGALMAFIQYVNMIMFSLIMISMIFIMFPRAQASADRINEVLEIVPDISDPQQETLSQTERKGYVEFENVTFSYPGAEQAAVSNLSFSVQPGEFTAIIGGTGSGKTTLINLIPRFYDIESGTIRVDGVDIREMSQANLRSKIGYVPQQALLFSGTIAENIRYGKEDAPLDEVKSAAIIAQADSFIEEMPKQYDTWIDQGGANFSGGQKQRLSIARALVRKPEIYIFDDSFSALDFKTDAKLRAALKDKVVDSTIIIVAQRVSTVLDADRIIVMDNGQIAGIGTHRELIRTCNVYREIVSSQLSEEELA